MIAPAKHSFLCFIPSPSLQVENIPAFIAGVKAKKEKLFGFGHRVYRNFDPRAKIIKEVRCKRIQNKKRGLKLSYLVPLHGKNSYVYQMF